MAPRPPRPVAYIRTSRGTRVKRAGEFSWNDAKDMDLLGEGDQVKTSEGGEADLSIEGKPTKVGRGSLLQVRSTRNKKGVR